jgi:signal transduction histidine kinase
LVIAGLVASVLTVEERVDSSGYLAGLHHRRLARALAALAQDRQAGANPAGHRELGPARRGRGWRGGCAVGVGLALLFPSNLLAQMISVLAVGGMCAGAAAALSSYWPAFYSFLFPALLPIAMRLGWEGTGEYLAMSALVLVYAAGLSLVARNLGTAFAQSLRLQLEKDGLLRSRDRLLASLEQRVQERTAELQSSNAQLTVEIAERRRAGEAERRARAAKRNAPMPRNRSSSPPPAHDLRQPFQAMRLFHHILLSRLSDASMREIATRLGEAMQAGEELLNALLDISTLEAGTVEAAPHRLSDPADADAPGPGVRGAGLGEGSRFPHGSVLGHGAVGSGVCSSACCATC